MIDKEKVLYYQPYGQENRYEVFFITQLDELDKFKSGNFQKILIVVDSAINKEVYQAIERRFKRDGVQTKIWLFKYGPKSLENLSLIWQQMINFVPDLIVGVGGGTTSDLVGLAAATYQRGIPHMLFPTTVLGMVDASLGGKTAIDFSGVKNSIGAIHYPKIVINVMENLKTLPKEEFFSGFAEIVKAGILFDKSLFQSLLRYAWLQDYSYDNPSLLSLMKNSAILKMKNSEQPIQHKVKLLYGHAIGHALEINKKSKLRHGDAVSIGMVVEGAIACVLGIWNKEEWKLQKDLLQNLKLPIEFPEVFSTEEVIEKMKLYKKLVTKDAFGFILPKKIGKVSENDQGYITFINKNKMADVLKDALKFIDEKL